MVEGFSLIRVMEAHVAADAGSQMPSAPDGYISDPEGGRTYSKNTVIRSLNAVVAANDGVYLLRKPENSSQKPDAEDSDSNKCL